MTKQEILYKLKNDFAFLVAVIVNNNPVAVTENLNKVYDKNVENREALINVILEFKEAGQDDLVKNILSVPFIENNASNQLVEAWRQIQADIVAVQGGGSRTAEFKDWSGGMFMAIGMLGSAYLNRSGLGGGGQYTPDPYVEQDNTMWWIIGAIALLIIVAIIVLVMKRKK